jgi:conjugative transfer region protein (TIGR03750 family)
MDHEPHGPQAGEAGTVLGTADPRPHSPLTDRVNVEPPILNGMTASEASMIGALALGAWVVVGLLGAAVLGRWQVLLAAAIFGPMVTLWKASVVLARIKRNRPDAYYRQAAQLWLSSRGLSRTRFIRHDGHWELGRAFGISLAPDRAQVRRRRERTA